MIIAFAILVLVAFAIAERAQTSFVFTLFFLVVGVMMLADVVLK